MNRHRLTRTSLCLPLSIIAPLVASCAAHSRSVYDPQTETARDPAKAQALTMKAADLIARDPTKAEKLLREALAADLYHGPAHNNLGVIYLSQGKLYDATGEFEWAKKLLPGLPDPRMNLALTLERAGRTDQALAAYRSALETYPDHLPTIEAMTRLQVKSGRVTDETRNHLDDIALRGENEKWRQWAQLQLIKRP